MLIGVNERGQALPISDAITSVVTTRPGHSAMYLEHALLKLALKDLNTPMSKGCNI